MYILSLKEKEIKLENEIKLVLHSFILKPSKKDLFTYEHYPKKNNINNQENVSKNVTS